MRLFRILGLLVIALIAVITPTSLVSADGNERWEYYNTGADSQEEVYIPWYYAQTFTANYSHTVDYVKLKLQRENSSCGILTVEIMPTNTSGWPEGSALTSGTYNGLLLSNSSASWAVIDFIPDISLSANTTYAIVAHSTGVNTTDNINWLLDTTAASYSGGQYFNSSDGGFTFTNNSSRDFMFEVWGEDVLEITDCRVYSSYWEDDDWLVVLSYKNFYKPYYPNYNVKDYFDLELGRGSTVIAQIPLQQWGYRPGAIYLSADTAVMQEWGNASYWVKINGTFPPYPYVQCNLTTWKGEDLTDLDDWCMLLAGDMDDYYSPDDPFTVFSSTSGRALLSEEAGIYFNLGIPGLSWVIPEMFSVVVIPVNVSEGNWSTSLAEDPLGNLSSFLGDDITATLDTFGEDWFTLPADTGHKVLFWVIIFCVFGFMVTVGVPPGHHFAGLLLGLPIIVAASVVYSPMVMIVAVCVFVVLMVGIMTWWRNA